MKIALMQPYIFPYIGYFQLIQSVDIFIFYDDVNFIKDGWINRNRLLVNGNDYTFTVPLKNISSFKKINETEIDRKQFEIWKKKFFKTLDLNYRKFPFFDQALPLFQSLFYEKEYIYISELAKDSISFVLSYLGIEKQIVPSSVIYNNSHLSAQERVIDIVKAAKGTEYINVAGGQKLYNHSDFEKNGLVLKFIKPNPFEYMQPGVEAHLPWLSIIDIMMSCDKAEIKHQLNNYTLF